MSVPQYCDNVHRLVCGGLLLLLLLLLLSLHVPGQAPQRPARCAALSFQLPPPNMLYSSSSIPAVHSASHSVKRSA
jgi:hypothetical protein